MTIASGALSNSSSRCAVWTRSRDRDTYAAGLDRWIRYFDELGIGSLGLGAVVLRRRDAAANWVRADYLEDNITSPAGHHIERLFAAEDRLARLKDDEAVLSAVFKTASDHELQQRLRLADARYAIDEAKVVLSGGLTFHGNVDLYAIQLLARCDGTRPLEAIALEIAAQAGLDAAQFKTACAGIARRLVAMGFLI